MSMVKSVLGAMTVLFSLAAAAAWWWSARVQAPAGEGTAGVGALLGGDLVALDKNGRRYDVMKTAILQSRWNAIGALFAGGAALAQGVTMMVPGEAA